MGLMTYSVKIILLVNLSLDLALDAQTNDIGISLARDSSGVRIDQGQCLLKCCHALPRSLLFLLDVVLEVA